MKNRLPTAVPKPRKKPAPAKRFSSIREKSHAEKLKAAQRLRSGSPLPKQNTERIARKAVSYRQGMARYRKSETWKAVEARACGQCEVQSNLTLMPWNIAFSLTPIPGHYRCPTVRGDGFRMEHHHLTYARFGGNELPEDMALVCSTHHRLIESQRGKRR